MKKSFLSNYPVGFCIFAAPDDDTGAGDARDYIREQGLTSNDVRLVKRDSQILVLTKQQETQ